MISHKTASLLSILILYLSGCYTLLRKGFHGVLWGAININPNLDDSRVLSLSRSNESNLESDKTQYLTIRAILWAFRGRITINSSER